MKQIVVLSGKGGTGKTTVTASLAHLASLELSVVLADADVDAANLGLVLNPVKQETHEFVGGKPALIDEQACIVKRQLERDISDHGEMLGDHHLVFKGTSHDGATNTPLIVSGPGVPEPLAPPVPAARAPRWSAVWT